MVIYELSRAWCLTDDGKIMTGRVPYSTERTDFLVIKAIMQSELPGSLDHPSIPKFAEAVLAKCWSTEPSSRPTMIWCSECFSWKTVELFDTCYGNSLDRAPSDYQTEGDGWRGVRNPVSSTTYEFDFALNLHGVGCVVRPSFPSCPSQL